MRRRSQTETAVLGALSVEPMTGYAVREAIRIGAEAGVDHVCPICAKSDEAAPLASGIAPPPENSGRSSPL